MEKRTIIVSNRLPVTIKKLEGKLQFSPSAGGLATGLGSTYRAGNNLWIGWPGSHKIEDSEKAGIEATLRKDNMAPVYLTHQDVQEYYEGFSNRTLWPLFHYFTEYVHYEENLWQAYVRVNRHFCDCVLQHARSGDTIWVHDYQLLLLPGMLREALPESSIGFFQHIPFPSFEIFRLLPWRKQILEGIMGADLIGFHTYDDVRHFLSSVNRIAGIGSTMGELKVNNRPLAVDAFPMGIDYGKFASAAVSKETGEKVKKYAKLFKGKKIILSIDRLDYSKGIKQRLHAFDLFLEQHPEYIGKVSMILLVVPSRDKVDHYQQLKEEIDTLVGRLDGKYSRLEWAPIHYFYRALPFHTLSALYSQSDVALITPLRDGMNLVCKEFIASKPYKKGVLILSEMAGAAKELSESLLINPNDLNQMAGAIHQALNMQDDEQEARISEMQEIVKRYNVHRWVEVFLGQLAKIKEKQLSFGMRAVNTKVAAEILKKYKAAKQRVLFLDYDGTLQGFSPNPKSASPDPELNVLLEKLSADPLNKIVVISGRDRTTLEKWIGHLPIDIVAEHGVWLKEPKTGDARDWQMIDDLAQDWKPQIRHLLEMYVDRTPGSFIEDKDYSLVWHYRKAETEFGELRARELLSNLNYLTANMHLQAMEGNKVIEIKDRYINKGRAAKRWLHNQDYGFVLAVGDDTTDEDTFGAMPEDAYTIKVGTASTIARLNIKSPKEVRELLGMLAGHSNQQA